jgi:hypothetical protein
VLDRLIVPARVVEVVSDVAFNDWGERVKLLRQPVVM